MTSGQADQLPSWYEQRVNDDSSVDGDGEDIAAGDQNDQDKGGVEEI